jgi:hypothetical protein
LVLALPLAGCTWLVAFDTLPCDGGPCADAAPAVQDSGVLAVDGPVLVTDTGSIPDSAHKDVVSTTDSAPAPPDSFVVADVTQVDSTVTDTGSVDTSTQADTYINLNPCAGQADGTNWNVFDSNALCCGGQPVEATADPNCGVCGLTCNTAAGQSCGPITVSSGTHYLCLNCVLDTDCWSGCCGTSVSPAHCAANDCSTGVCSTTSDPCTQFSGAMCVTNGVGYCAY